MKEIVVESLNSRAVETHEIEMVERKGKGHPDYIADGASEAVSLALCKHYRKEYGRILHHNVDKSLVVGGKAAPTFGGGQV
jgi:S-adenosylmethionine synthetase